MMVLKRIATWKRSQQGKAVVIEVGKQRFEISHDDKAIYDTESKLKAEVDRQASLSTTQLPNIFYHINRDGSIAVATGQEPTAWPEDEPNG